MEKQEVKREWEVKGNPTDKRVFLSYFWELPQGAVLFCLNFQVSNDLISWVLCSFSLKLVVERGQHGNDWHCVASFLFHPASYQHPCPSPDTFILTCQGLPLPNKVSPSNLWSVSSESPTETDNNRFPWGGMEIILCGSYRLIFFYKFWFWNSLIGIYKSLWSFFGKIY